MSTTPPHERLNQPGALLSRSQHHLYNVDECPCCGGPKKKRAKHCRSCWRSIPKPLTSDRPRTGRQYARAHFELAAACERCEMASAVDRHHKDGNPLNNVSGNIASLCRRCHMEVDGRIKAGGIR